MHNDEIYFTTRNFLQRIYVTKRLHAANRGHNQRIEQHCRGHRNGNEEEPPEGYEFIEIETETGTSDYEQLINKPKIEGEELLGNKTFEELNLNALTNLELEELINRQV